MTMLEDNFEELETGFNELKNAIGGEDEIENYHHAISAAINVCEMLCQLEIAPDLLDDLESYQAILEETLEAIEMNDSPWQEELDEDLEEEEEDRYYTEDTVPLPYPRAEVKNTVNDVLSIVEEMFVEYDS